MYVIEIYFAVLSRDFVMKPYFVQISNVDVENLQAETLNRFYVL